MNSIITVIPTMSSTKLTSKDDIRAFQTKINSCFNELRKIGVRCKKNWTCCASCGHSEIADEWDGDYVFYHLQETQNLRDGDNVVSLKHSISDKNRQKVIDILKKYGSDWAGDNERSMDLPFINYTPEEIEKRTKEHIEWLENIRRYRESIRMEKEDKDAQTT